MSEYAKFFLNGSSKVVQIETLEISHPAFSKVYWIVRNSRLGLTAKLETGEMQYFEYFPLKISKADTDNSLDQIFRVSIGDLGEILPQELDRVAAMEDGFLTKPKVNYRIYRSDDLNQPILGPMRLEIVALPFDRNGVAFEAKAPSLNQNQTGEIYDLTRFPGLRGYL